MVTILQNVLVFILFYSFIDQYSDSRDMTVTTSLVIGAIQSQNDVKKFKWDQQRVLSLQCKITFLSLSVSDVLEK